MSGPSVSGHVSGGGKHKHQALSTSTIVAAGDAEGSHVLTIDGSFWRKKLGNGAGASTDGFKSDPPFSIGGHTWYITAYNSGANFEWISLYLALAHTVDTHVDAHLRFSLLDHAGDPVPSHVCEGDAVFTDIDFTSGFPWFIQRKALEESSYLVDARFRVRCDIRVKNHGGTHAGTGAVQLIAVPPPDMHSHIGGLLSWQDGVDITFEVGGETFAAHRVILAARLPVFRAELFGPMKEKDMSHVRINDMEASVFRAMFHFIYCDSPPEIDKEDMPAMAQHLLVAADRYGLERLKLICEDKLWYNISTSTVATTLVLADRHGCHGLKEACFEFLKTTRNLKAVMATDGYEHLMTCFPSFLKELVDKLALSCSDLK